MINALLNSPFQSTLAEVFTAAIKGQPTGKFLLFGAARPGDGIVNPATAIGALAPIGPTAGMICMKPLGGINLDEALVTFEYSSDSLAVILKLKINRRGERHRLFDFGSTNFATEDNYLYEVDISSNSFGSFGDFVAKCFSGDIPIPTANVNEDIKRANGIVLDQDNALVKFVWQDPAYAGTQHYTGDQGDMTAIYVPELSSTRPAFE